VKGDSCTVAQGAGSATIDCEDGSSATVNDGAQGPAGLIDPTLRVYDRNGVEIGLLIDRTTRGYAVFTSNSLVVTVENEGNVLGLDVDVHWESLGCIGQPFVDASANSVGPGFVRRTTLGGQSVYFAGRRGAPVESIVALSNATPDVGCIDNPVPDPRFGIRADPVTLPGPVPAPLYVAP